MLPFASWYHQPLAQRGKLCAINNYGNCSLRNRANWLCSIDRFGCHCDSWPVTSPIIVVVVVVFVVMEADQFRRERRQCAKVLIDASLIRAASIENSGKTNRERDKSPKAIANRKAEGKSMTIFAKLLWFRSIGATTIRWASGSDQGEGEALG